MKMNVGIGILGLSNHEQDALLAACDIIKNLHNTLSEIGLCGIEKTSTGEVIETDELNRVMGILDGLTGEMGSWNGIAQIENEDEKNDWDYEDEDDYEEDEDDLEEPEEDALTEAIRKLLKDY